MHVAGTDMSFEVARERAAPVRQAAGDEFIVGIRPQNMQFAHGNGAVSAEVLINEYLGERSILTVENGSARFRALVPPETMVKKGDMVRLKADPGDVMVFDVKTQALIT